MSRPPNQCDDQSRVPMIRPDTPGDDDPESAARAICLRMLATAPRTWAQLARGLQRRGVEEDIAHVVLDQLGTAGLVDDAAFADAWVDSRHTGRGLGKERLAGELRQRGVDEETIDDAVADIGPEQEEAAARQLVRRKLTSTRAQPAETRVRRVMGMLGRRGYSAGLSYRLVREELEAEGCGVEDLPEPDFG